MGKGGSVHISSKALKRLVNEHVADDVEVYGYKVAKNIEAFTPQELHPHASSEMTKNKKGYPVALQKLHIDWGTPEELQAHLGVFSRAATASGLEYGQND